MAVKVEEPEIVRVPVTFPDGTVEEVLFTREQYTDIEAAAARHGITVDAFLSFCATEAAGKGPKADSHGSA